MFLFLLLFKMLKMMKIFILKYEFSVSVITFDGFKYKIDTLSP